MSDKKCNDPSHGRWKHASEAPQIDGEALEAPPEGNEVEKGVEELRIAPRLNPMRETTANKVYDTLVEYAGASPLARDEFVMLQTSDYISGYRFMGHLGFGGKFWRYSFMVTCYPEDYTPERKEMINRTNWKLSQLIMKGLDREGDE